MDEKKGRQPLVGAMASHPPEPPNLFSSELYERLLQGVVDKTELSYQDRVVSGGAVALDLSSFLQEELPQGLPVFGHQLLEHGVLLIHLPHTPMAPLRREGSKGGGR